MKAGGLLFSFVFYGLSTVHGRKVMPGIFWQPSTGVKVPDPVSIGDEFLGGRRFANRIVFADFEDNPSYIMDNMQRVWNNHSVPLLTMMLYDPRRGTNLSSEIKWGEVVDLVANTHLADQHIWKWIKPLEDFITNEDGRVKRRAWFRFAHEMNGNWYDWYTGPNSTISAATYVSAWQKWRRIFNTSPILSDPTNIQWIWCPNDLSTWKWSANDINLYYPGDDYVDWVAFDAYDLPSYNGGVRSSVNTMFSSTMAVLKTLAPNKPLMIAETGCDAEHVNGFPNSTDYAGKRLYLNQLCALIRNNTRIRAVNIWNVDTCAKGYCYQISIFSYGLIHFVPKFYYPEYTDCVLDDNLFLWSNKTGRLISDNAFQGIDDDDDETQSSTTSTIVGRGSSKGNDTSPLLSTADDSDSTTQGPWELSRQYRTPQPDRTKPNTHGISSKKKYNKVSAPAGQEASSSQKNIYGFQPNDHGTNSFDLSVPRAKVVTNPSS